MPVLEIITIGTELLLGEITDTNSTYIARTLRDHGIDIYRITTIGDNPVRIAAAIKEALDRADIIITTGGLGPTVDDPTRQAVADAVDSELVFMEDLWDQILTRFQAYGREPTKNNRRQAYIPEGAIPVSNPVGTAPCFIVERDSAYIISLPGVPQEMKHILHHKMIPFLKDRFQLKSHIIKATVLHVASMGESAIDELIADLERYANPTVGLLAHPGQVDVRVTVKARSEDEASEMVRPIIEELHQRLGDNIYGHDEVTLAGVISAHLEENDLRLNIIAYGFDETLDKLIHEAQSQKITIARPHEQPPGLSTLTSNVRQEYQKHKCDLAFGLALQENTHVDLHLVYQDAQHTNTETRHYGGPREYTRLWAGNIGLDYLRRNLALLAVNN